MKGYIYKIINKIDGRIYIGSTINFEKRKKKHLKDLKNNKHHNIFLQRAYNKYGVDNFVFSYKEKEFNNKNDLQLLEERYINFCWKSNILYNISKKGSGGDLISYHPNLEEIKKKHSKNTKERYEKMTCEEKEKLSESMRGERNHNFGKKWEEKKRIEASNRMKEKYENNEDLFFNKLKGKTFEELYGEEKAKILKENLSKIASNRIKEKNAFFGKHHSDETKRILSEKKKGVKPINCKKVLFNGIIYNSASDCAKKLNINYLTVCYRAKNNIYGFSYVGENDDKEQRVAKIMWDKEKCENIAKYCKTKKEFRNKSISAYDFSKKHGFLEEFSKKYFNELRHYWTFDEIMKICEKYNSYKDFRQNEYKAYRTLLIHKEWYENVKKYYNLK